MGNTPVQAKRRLSCVSCGLRFIAGSMALLIAMLVIGYGLQQIGLSKDRAQFPAPGQRIDVSGHRLHLWCLGEAKPDTPTVILEAGLGRTSLDWAHVLPQIAATSRVCAYDRAGYGWSDAGPNPRSLEQNSRDLHTLLTHAGITSSLILVGHSYGGALVQHYAALYPEQIRGIILVDAMHEREWANSSAEEQQYLMQEQGKLTTIAFLNRFGILRTFGGLLGSGSLPVPIASLAPEQQGAYASFLLRAEYYETWLSEIQALQGTLPQHLPHDMPLIVLTAGQPAKTSADAAQANAEMLHASLQKDLLNLSTNSRQQIVDSGHDIPLEHPEAVISAIQSLLDSMR